jgi:hypothetical protein
VPAVSADRKKVQDSAFFRMLAKERTPVAEVM